MKLRILSILVIALVITSLILPLALSDDTIIIAAEPAEQTEGQGTPSDPYKWNGGVLGVDSFCEAYFFNGVTWISKTILGLGGDYSTVQGDGSEVSPFRIGEGGTKALFCDLATVPPVKIMYWDKINKAWVFNKPVETRAARPEEKVAATSTLVSTQSRPPPPIPSPLPITDLARQIDEVWKTIRGWLGFPSGSDQATKIWDNGWKTFEAVYPSPGLAPLGEGPEAYDSIIQEAAGKFNVEAALIKAIIKHESNFDPNEISPTGCKGLMQVCGWKEYSVFLAGNGLPNDPFNPRANIFVGTVILQNKIAKTKGCSEGEDKIKCIIAAYNAGEGLITAAANTVSPPPATWVQVNQKLQDENFVESYSTSDGYKPYGDDRTWKGRGNEDQRWSDPVECPAAKAGGLTRRVCKFRALDGYVQKVFSDYESYKTSFASS